MILNKSVLVCLIFNICNHGICMAQDIPNYQAEQLEAPAEKNDAEPEDDEYELTLEQFIRHPINMNVATQEVLEQLHLLQVIQIQNFLNYRKLLGPLLAVHELQSVPGWDVVTIYKLLPYIIVAKEETLYSALQERWKKGDRSFLIRCGQTLEKSKGFEKYVKPGASYYEGSAQKVYIRYAYNYKQLLSYGFTGEKDAGEPFLTSAQKYGFDFYSFHLFLQQTGIIRALAIGDFTVNMGQGLIQWQTTAFTKSSSSMSIKREANFLKPYHAAGEYNFHRGLGITLQKKKWQTSLFISSQKISTNLEPDSTGEDLFSSFQQSGYHRTPSEIEDRNNSQQFSAGGNIRYSGNRFGIGLNYIYFQFSRPFQKRDEPYNLYSLKGKQLTDYSLDYDYTTGNLHLFGEFAADRWKNLAFIQGALLSLGENLDMSFIYRNISPSFKSLYSDAFTKNSVPNNERGLYTGIAFRPVPGVQVNFYYDLFVFPWLKYQIDAPANGRDILVNLNFQPNKFWKLTTIYKYESKIVNQEFSAQGTHQMINSVKQRWRVDTDYTVSRNIGFTSRMEFVWIKTKGAVLQKGFLGTAGFSFKKSALSGNIAATIFETDNYDSRIYIYESDLLYNYSLPAYYGKGLHYYINIHRDLTRLIPHAGKGFRLMAWLKWGQTFYPGVDSIGTGLDEITGNRKSEVKAQLLLQWQ